MRLDRKTLRKILFEEVEMVAAEVTDQQQIPWSPDEPLEAAAPGVDNTLISAISTVVDFSATNGGLLQFKKGLQSQFTADIGSISQEEILIALRDWLNDMDLG